MSIFLSGYTFNFIGQIRCIISLDAGGHAAKAVADVLSLQGGMKLDSTSIIVPDIVTVKLILPYPIANAHRVTLPTVHAPGPTAFAGLIPIVVEKPGLDIEYILGIPVAGNPIAPQDVTVDFSFGFIAV